MARSTFPGGHLVSSDCAAYCVRSEISRFNTSASASSLPSARGRNCRHILITLPSNHSYPHWSGRATVDPGSCSFRNKPSSGTPHERRISCPNSGVLFVQIAGAHPEVWWPFVRMETLYLPTIPHLALLDTTCEVVQDRVFRTDGNGRTSETTDQLAKFT